MARKKRTNDPEDWKRYNKFKEENTKLRKEITKLRKLIKQDFEDLLEEREERVKEGLPPIKLVCEVCGNDNLNELPIKRPDGNFSVRICNSCGHRHKMKKLKE